METTLGLVLCGIAGILAYRSGGNLLALIAVIIAEIGVLIIK